MVFLYFPSLVHEISSDDPTFIFHTNNLYLLSLSYFFFFLVSQGRGYQYYWSFQGIKFWSCWFSLLFSVFSFNDFCFHPSFFFFFFSACLRFFSSLSNFLKQAEVLIFRYFSFCNIFTKFYKFPSKYFFSYIPQFLVNCDFCFTYFKMFFNLYLNFFDLWTI